MLPSHGAVLARTHASLSMASAEHPKDSLAPPSQSGDGSGSPPWLAIATPIAAAAGGAAWVSAVGSAIMAIRLENAELPALSVVALMPVEHRFSLGASYLIAPLFVGLVGFLADWALTARWASSVAQDPSAGGPGGTQTTTSHRRRRWADKARHTPRSKRERVLTRGPLALFTIFLGFGLGMLLLRPPLIWLFVLQILAICGVMAAVLLLAPAEATGAYERVLVFVLVLLTASGLAFAFERSLSPAFDIATLTTTDEGRVVGYYITKTSDAVVLITLGCEDERTECPNDRSPRRITAVPSDQIQRLSIGPRNFVVDAKVLRNEMKTRE